MTLPTSYVDIRNTITPELVLNLQRRRSYPSVSVLLGTTPAPQLTDHDRATLNRQVEDTISRVSAEMSPENSAGREWERASVLRGLVEEVATRKARGGLGLFVSDELACAVIFPEEVPTRTQVDDTFATRDLVRSLHRTATHVVLVLNAGQARLFVGGAGGLRGRASSGFPMLQSARSAASDAAATREFLLRVDRALGTFLRLHPAPLVLVGPDKVLSAFRSLSRNTGRLAGTIAGNLARASLAELERRTRVLLLDYLRSRQDEALAHLRQREDDGRVAIGLEAAWLAVRHERPEMLAVEEGLFFPARLSEDGDRLFSSDDVTAPEVVDDVVDELIEHALARGAWVAFTEDGALADYSRVAMSLRR